MADANATAPLSPRVPGEDDSAIAFDDLARNRELATTMALRARRTLAIFTPDLEAAIYDHRPFLAALRRLATSSSMARVRILVRDPTRAVKDGHRLIETSRRLSSTVHIHRAATEHRELAHSVLVADDTGFIHRPIAARREGQASFRAGARCRELLRWFDALWDASAPDAELRRLHL